MSVLALEFDAHHFQDAKSCFAWLQDSGLDYITGYQGFRLRLRKNSLFLTGETRKVWCWYHNLWRYPDHTVLRPNVHLAVVKSVGDYVFKSNDIPEQLPETIQRMEKQAKKQAIRQENEQKRREKQKLKRQAQREKKRKQVEQVEGSEITHNAKRLKTESTSISDELPSMTILLLIRQNACNVAEYIANEKELS